MSYMFYSSTVLSEDQDAHKLLFSEIVTDRTLVDLPQV